MGPFNFDIQAEIAGGFGTTVIFLSGDQAAADELKVVERNAVTAVAARELIQRRTKESVSKLDA